jgi:hypothetical protein
LISRIKKAEFSNLQKILRLAVLKNNSPLVRRVIAGCRIFKAKIPNWVNFYGLAVEEVGVFYMWPFGIFVIWQIPPVLVKYCRDGNPDCNVS